VRRFKRPSPAMVVACLALLVALTGTSVAAVSQLPRASVGTPQLKRNAVTAQKINPNAIRSGHVLNGSLLSEDFKPGQIPAGPQGPQGPPGAQGVPGPQERWAQVSSTGSIIAQSGGITASRVSAGSYSVTFPGANVLDKPILATASRTSNVASLRYALASACGGPPQGVNCGVNNNANSVLVNTRDAGVTADSSFYVMVVP
jgi:hypothetical protein